MNTIQSIILSAVLMCIGGLTSAFAAEIIQPIELRCEYHVNPLGIDVVKPRFSWQLESAQRNQQQSAYRTRPTQGVVRVRMNFFAQAGEIEGKGKNEEKT